MGSMQWVEERCQPHKKEIGAVMKEACVEYQREKVQK